MRPEPDRAPVAPVWPPLTVGDPDGPDQAWVEPDPDGGCRASHPIKVNATSGIYHLPTGASYRRTRAERCYADAGDAEADGFRAARR